MRPLVLLICLYGTVICETTDWWKSAIFYQIYPRSFKDQNNDGIGDLQGVIGKLDYLKETGITAAWLSPIFKSLQVDQGYDISDYRSIDPQYGTLDDFKILLEKAHKLGLKIILDFVPNHTSDQHPWFKKSLKKLGGFDDFYVWANAKYDEFGKRKPPNNWISLFKDSAWSWDEERGQYYLHQFAEAQPDLNYRNPKVVEEMKDILKFWMDLGVDGFRIDAVPFLFENADLLDEPLSNSSQYKPNDYEYLDHVYTKDLDETFDMIYQWRQLLDEYSARNPEHTRIMMTEAYTTLQNTMRYFGNKDGSKLGAHFTFNFDFITYLTINSNAKDILDVINKWRNNLPNFGTYNWVLGNHDNHRVATRLGLENIDGYNMLTAMLKGIVVTYNGEEIGQEDGEVTCEEGQDPSAIKNCARFQQTSRDFERTPFQWDNSTNAGFNTGAKSWLPVSIKANITNLAMQKPKSVLSHYNVYQQVMELRKVFNSYAWSVGTHGENFGVIEVKRYNDKVIYSLQFNVGKETVTISYDDVCEIILTGVNSSYKVGDKIENKSVNVKPHESIILKCLK